MRECLPRGIRQKPWKVSNFTTIGLQEAQKKPENFQPLFINTCPQQKTKRHGLSEVKMEVFLQLFISQRRAELFIASASLEIRSVPAPWTEGAIELAAVSAHPHVFG